MLDVADRRDDQVRRAVDAREIAAEPILRQRFDRFLRAENRPAERMTLPEALGEQLVDQVVRRVLDHLDLFEDDLLLALDVVRAERRVHDDVGEDVDGERQMLVEHLDVVARVLLRRERVHLTADRVDRLRDVLGAAGGRPLEEHVLDKVGDAALLLRLVARAAREPDADADGAHVRHPLRKETETIREHVADDRWLRHGMRFRETAAAGPLPVTMRRLSFGRKLLTDRELEEQRHHIMKCPRKVLNESERLGSPRVSLLQSTARISKKMREIA